MKFAIDKLFQQLLHHFADLNNGKEFFPRYDRRHALSLVGIYQLKPHITLSGSWIYATGNALTVPIGQYIPETHQFPVQSDYPTSDGSLIVARVYDERGNFKAADYHRLDVNVRFSKQKKKFLRVWELGIFNAYNRVNPFYYESQDAPNSTQRKLYRKGLFPIIPSDLHQPPSDPSSPQPFVFHLIIITSSLLLSSLSSPPSPIPTKIMRSSKMKAVSFKEEEAMEPPKKANSRRTRIRGTAEKVSFVCDMEEKRGGRGRRL